MTTPQGDAEARLRHQAVARLRLWFPGSRIVHELNVEMGSHRADVAAVMASHLILCEIKSHRDNLEKLNRQVGAFHQVAHLVIVAADDKWSEQEIRARMGGRRHVPIWRAEHGRLITKGLPNKWIANNDFSVPWTAKMLNLLWADELRDVCARAHIEVPKRCSRPVMIETLLMHMPCRICELYVCRQLRAREFANADDPIIIKDDHASEPYIAGHDRLKL